MRKCLTQRSGIKILFQINFLTVKWKKVEVGGSFDV